MNCPGCGLENLPQDEACAFCEEALGPGERAAEWERLGPALREEFSRNYERALERRRVWLATHRRRRIVHVALGALVLPVLAAVTHGPAGAAAGLLWLAMDVALGAAAGFLLNHVRGGEYQGLLAFGAAYAASTAAKGLLGTLGLSMAFGFFVFPGFLVALCLGYLFGLNLSMRRSIED